MPMNKHLARQRVVQRITVEPEPGAEPDSDTMLRNDI